MTESELPGFGALTAGMNLLTDIYERKARLYPALLALMPVALVVACGLGTRVSVVEVGCGVIVSCGGLLLLAQIARDAGERKELSLFEKWGGLPSVKIFRHRDTRLDSITKNRLHKRLASLLKDAKAPSAIDEATDPASADKIYASWSTFIRINTRDTRKYTLLFRENINYGYRRNVFGLRPIGISASLFSMLGALAWLYLKRRSTGEISTELVVASVITLLLLLLWLFYFSSDWVHVPAEAYAERLVEAIDSLTPNPEREESNPLNV